MKIFKIKNLISIFFLTICINVNAQNFFVVDRIVSKKNWTMCYLSIGSKIQIYETTRNYKEVSALKIGSCNYVVLKSTREWDDASSNYAQVWDLAKFNDYSNKNVGVFKTYDIDNLDPNRVRFGIGLFNDLGNIQAIQIVTSSSTF